MLCWWVALVTSGSPATVWFKAQAALKVIFSVLYPFGLEINIQYNQFQYKHFNKETFALL